MRIGTEAEAKVLESTNRPQKVGKPTPAPVEVKTAELVAAQ